MHKKDTFEILNIKVSENEFENISYIFQTYGSTGSYWQNDEPCVCFLSTLDDTKRKDIILEIEKILVRRISCSFKQANNEDWLATFRKNFTCFDFINGYTVCPPNCKKHTSGAIYINPGMGFGTGKHPTTKMCAELIKEISSDTKTMLDVGSGSGILSILAKKLGLKLVECIEIDEQARENAEENLQLNNIELKTYTNIDNVKNSYDLVVANIITPTLVSLKILLENLTQKYLVLSGILNVEEKIILENFGNNFQLIQKKTMDEWTALLFKKTQPISPPR